MTSFNFSDAIQNLHSYNSSETTVVVSTTPDKCTQRSYSQRDNREGVEKERSTVAEVFLPKVSSGLK